MLQGREEQRRSPDEAKGNLGKPLIPGLRLLRSRDCGQGARALHSGYPSASATKPSIRDILETMKAARAKAKTTAFDDIVETLRRVPKAHLGVVRDLVHVLATPQATNGQRKTRARKKLSLLDTPFCGMWADREDITDERTYARQLRRMLETGGDRRKNVR